VRIGFWHAHRLPTRGIDHVKAVAQG
jgi:hypothetical protein